MCHQLHDHQRRLSFWDHPEEANLENKWDFPSRLCPSTLGRVQLWEPGVITKPTHPERELGTAPQSHLRLRSFERAKVKWCKQIHAFYKIWQVKIPALLINCFCRKAAFVGWTPRFESIREILVMWWDFHLLIIWGSQRCLPHDGSWTLSSQKLHLRTRCARGGWLIR